MLMCQCWVHTDLSEPPLVGRQVDVWVFGLFWFYLATLLWLIIQRITYCKYDLKMDSQFHFFAAYTVFWVQHFESLSPQRITYGSIGLFAHISVVNMNIAVYSATQGCVKNADLCPFDQFTTGTPNVSSRTSRGQWPGNAHVNLCSEWMLTSDGRQFLMRVECGPR